jgi:hypothetical protein
VVFSLAARLFGATIPTQAKDCINLTPALSQWIETYGESSALDNFNGSKFSLFLHREFISDQAAWRDICRRRLFPIHRPPHVPRGIIPAVSDLPLIFSQIVHVLRRVPVHLSGALRYAWESHRWRRLRRANPAIEMFSAKGNPRVVGSL